MFDFAKLKRTISSLGDESKKLNLEIETLKKRREELQALPRSREDLAAVLDGWLVGQRGQFLETLKKNVQFLIDRPQRELQPGEDLRIFQHVDMLGTKYMNDGVLLALMPNAREILTQAVMDLPGYPEEAGESWPKRAAEIEKLDKQIGALEAKIEDLKTSASAAGIQLEPAAPPVQPDYSGGEPIHPEARQIAHEKANQS